MEAKMYLSLAHMGGQEMKYVQEAFDQNWIAPLGPNVDGFEKELASYLGVGHAAALSSGTAAIHLALIILGIKAGDEVLCSSFTFSASANPIVYVGASPVFVDSERETWNMSPDSLELAIKRRLDKGIKPKAIILVHLYGMPAKMDELMAIAAKHDIPVIEDAAEALGSSYKGKKLGTFGKMGVLSFNGNKIITTSGGGALVSDNAEYIEKARFLATQARDAAPHYQHSQIGYNYRMSNVCAGIGRGQLQVLEERIAQRRANYEIYKRELNGYKGISFFDEAEGFFSNRWLTTILIDQTKNFKYASRETVRVALEKENIEARPVWKPMHMQPVFERCAFVEDGTSEKLFLNGLCLPSGTLLKESDLLRVCEVIKKVLG